MKSLTGLVILLILFQKVYYTMALKGMKLAVPRAVRAGHSVTLGCDYDLEDAALYSVKWYRENQEFYRYVPKEEPPFRVFPIQGIQVDVSVSNAKNVTLLSVNRDISGEFQCEVSADAPSFHTQVLSTPMTVAVVPVGVPQVSVNKSGLDNGRALIADCHAPSSYPACNITFFVNDEKVPGYTSEWINVLLDQLEERTARLELSGVGGSFDPLRIRCEASLFRLYRAKSREIQVRPDTPQVLLLETTSKGNLFYGFPITKPVWMEAFENYYVRADFCVFLVEYEGHKSFCLSASVTSSFLRDPPWIVPVMLVTLMFKWLITL